MELAEFLDHIQVSRALWEAQLARVQAQQIPTDWLPWRVIAGNTDIHYREHTQNLQAWLDAQAT
jgi:hypothetical protein